jgi:hypothetical protein
LQEKQVQSQAITLKCCRREDGHLAPKWRRLGGEWLDENTRELPLCTRVVCRNSRAQRVNRSVSRAGVFAANPGAPNTVTDIMLSCGQSGLSGGHSREKVTWFTQELI